MSHHSLAFRKRSLVKFVIVSHKGTTILGRDTSLAMGVLHAGSFNHHTHTHGLYRFLSVPPSLYTHLHPCQFTYKRRCKELNIQESLGMVESAAITIGIAFVLTFTPGEVRISQDWHDVNAHVKELIQPIHTLGKNMDEMDGFAIW